MNFRFLHTYNQKLISWLSIDRLYYDIPTMWFELQSGYCVHFWTNTLGKGVNTQILPCYGFKSTTTLLLQVWLWLWITHKDLCDKTKKLNKNKLKPLILIVEFSKREKTKEYNSAAMNNVLSFSFDVSPS